MVCIAQVGKQDGRGRIRKQQIFDKLRVTSRNLQNPYVIRGIFFSILFQKVKFGYSPWGFSIAAAL
jgi:hypothetical protein